MPKHPPRNDDNKYDDDRDQVSTDSASHYRSDDNGDKNNDRRKLSKKHNKKVKKHSSKREHKKKHKRCRRDREGDDYSVDDSERSRSRRKKRKKEKGRKRQRREEEDYDDDDDDTSVNNNNSDPISHKSHILAQALCHLFSERPVFAQELPILLIRLAGGATFDLRQMNDSVAATALEAVLDCLQEYGVQYNNSKGTSNGGGGEWLFQATPGIRDERALLRVIRALLEEVGVTMPAVGAYEAKLEEEKKSSVCKRAKEDDNDQDYSNNGNNPQDLESDRIKDLTSNLIFKYQSKDAELGFQLAGLCRTIAEGESISIDGLLDEELKAALEVIFVACGLEKSEMAEDDEDGSEDGLDADNTNGPSMGYCLPEGVNDTIPLKLAAVMQACRNPTRRVLGPIRPTPKQQAAGVSSHNSEDDDDDDEGPDLPGQERRRPRGPALPDHVVKAQAEHRELLLKATAAGIEIPTHAGGREEWMIIPGKFDFMSNIKRGEPMKSRGFQNKKTRGMDEDARPINPAIQAEIDAILQAHQDARGPSLMDQHRSKKQQDRMQEAGTDKKWKWSRDKDLDEGRRVDKDALHQVLGGAKTNLNSKFQGGFT